MWGVRGGGAWHSAEPVADGDRGEGGRSSVTMTSFSFLSPPLTLCVPEAPRFESIMEDVEVGAGETARFAVVVEGKPLPDIMWYKVRR